MDKKKILFIIPWLPYPMKSGGHQAIFNGIFAVKDLMEVSLAYEVYDRDEYERAIVEFKKQIPTAKHFPRFHIYKKPSVKRKVFNWMKSCAKSLSTIFHKASSQPAISTIDDCEWWKTAILPLNESWLLHIKEILNTQKFDIIQVEMPWLISQILTLPSVSKRIFVHHEIGIVRRNLEMEKLPKSPYVTAMKRFADFGEVGELNMYDAVVTLSSIDTNKLKQAGVKVPVHSSFAIVKPTEECRFVKAVNRLTFVGSDVHTPNLIGLQWFLSNCWKKLMNHNSQYTLSIIGKWSQTNIDKIKTEYPNIEFLGFVEDLVSVLRGSIMIVPITEGSGIRMKILEAGFMGIPFISTSVGAEGIPVVNGIHCFLADTPACFVDSITKLEDEDLQKSIVTEARKMVEKHFSISSLKENRMEIYNKTLGVKS